MHERQLTRIDSVRKQLDEMLKQCEDKETSRNGYVHLYGVGQACALIALHRGHDRKYAELAEIAGMLHDYSTYKDGTRENHAEKSSIEAERILRSIPQFTPEEISIVCQAISKHSDKEQVHTEFDEILKDADDMQHWLRNPVEEYFFQKERAQKVAREFGLMREQGKW
ncbi:MAG: HD domain-containing protein [Lachnospiraceae bacterium]|nr:HD domain-containing protein [Lachnospiraceae bacterium]